LSNSTSKNLEIQVNFRSLKVIGTDTDQLATYDILLTLHSNHEPILDRFRNKRPFQSKIVNFPTPCVFNAPAKGIRYRRHAWGQ